jgi:hypothetical protein
MYPAMVRRGGVVRIDSGWSCAGDGEGVCLPPPMPLLLRRVRPHPRLGTHWYR